MADQTDRPGPVVRIIEIATAAALASMVLLVCVLVLLRGIRVEGHFPTVASLQNRVLARYTYVYQLLPVMLYWMTFLGALLADRRRQHLGNDVLVGRLPDRFAGPVRLAMRFVWVAFFAVVTVLGVGQVAKGESLGGLRSIGLPAWAVQIGLPLGAGLLTVWAARSLLADLRRRSHSSQHVQRFERSGEPDPTDRGGRA